MHNEGVRMRTSDSVRLDMDYVRGHEETDRRREAKGRSQSIERKIRGLSDYDAAHSANEKYARREEKDKAQPNKLRTRHNHEKEHFDVRYRHL